MIFTTDPGTAHKPLHAAKNISIGQGVFWQLARFWGLWSGNATGPLVSLVKGGTFYKDPDSERYMYMYNEQVEFAEKAPCSDTKPMLANRPNAALLLFR